MITNCRFKLPVNITMKPYIAEQEDIEILSSVVPGSRLHEVIHNPIESGIDGLSFPFDPAITQFPTMHSSCRVMDSLSPERFSDRSGLFEYLMHIKPENLTCDKVRDSSRQSSQQRLPCRGCTRDCTRFGQCDGKPWRPIKSG